MSPRCARTRARRDYGSSHLELLEDRQMLATFNPLPTYPDGSPGSLRAAIIQADSNGQDNTINLAAGTYQLSVANTGGQENASATGDLDLTGSGHTITIRGAGAAATIIDGGKLDRVFQILYGVTAVLSGLTIQNGVAQDGGTAGAMPGAEGALGGGILNLGTATLDGVVVQNCVAAGTLARTGLPGLPPRRGAAGCLPRAAASITAGLSRSTDVSSSITRRREAREATVQPAPVADRVDRAEEGPAAESSMWAR